MPRALVLQERIRKAELSQTKSVSANYEQTLVPPDAVPKVLPKTVKPSYNF